MGQAAKKHNASTARARGAGDLLHYTRTAHMGSFEDPMESTSQVIVRASSWPAGL